MICPVLAAGVLATPTTWHLSKLNLASDSAEVRAADRASACLESDCAFWIPEAGMCAVKAIGMQAASTTISMSMKINEYEDTH